VIEISNPQPVAAMHSREQRRMVKDGYERVARLYHLDRRTAKWGCIHEEMSELLSYLPKGGRVLDAGCGAGVPILETLKEEGFKVIGVDISYAMLVLSQWHVPGVDVIQADLTQLGLSKETFHGIVSAFTMIHIPRKYHKPVYAQFYGMLKPGGMMLVSTGLTSWEGVGDWYGVPMSWSHYDSDTSLKMIKNTGFEIIFHRVIEAGDEQHYWVLAKKQY
jgi:2-polyprenyl-3-methyl-5-hydroxy-6-metoxy-1,4-benzoquinol methylase